MRDIEISAAGCIQPSDLYEEILQALGSPSCHGRNLDALWDSITGGDLNEVNPPFRVTVHGALQLSPECETLLGKLEILFAEARTLGVAVEIHRR